MQPIRKPATRHHTAGKFVDQYNLAVAHNVVFVSGKQLMGPQTLIDMMHDGCAFGIIKRLPLWQLIVGFQQLFEKIIALICIGHVAGFFVQRKMRVLQIWDEFIDRNIKF